MSYVPKVSKFPDKEDYSLPVMQGLPMFSDDTWTLTRFLLAPFKRRKYIFTEDYFTFVDHVQMWVCIPRGYIYDIASIPLFLPGASHDGPLMYGAGPHDFIYGYGGLYLSKGPGFSFLFTEIGKEKGDMIFSTMNNKSNKMITLNEISRIILDKFGGPNYKPQDITLVEWEGAA